MSKLDIKGNKINIGDYVCYPIQPVQNKTGHISIFLVYQIDAMSLGVTCIAHLGEPNYGTGMRSLRLRSCSPEMTGEVLILPKHFITPTVDHQNLRAFLRLDGMEIAEEGFESIL